MTLVTLETTINVLEEDEWKAKEAARWKFFKTLMNAPKREQWRIILQMSSSIYIPPVYHSYMKDSENDAKMLISNYFLEEIIDQILSDGKASDDCNNDYDNGDEIFQYKIVYRKYDLTEAADLLSELYRIAEDDHGLWEGLEPERAICVQAAYTYGNAVYDEWTDLIAAINKIDLEDICQCAMDQIVKWQNRMVTKEDETYIAEYEIEDWIERIDEKDLFDDICYALVEQEIREMVE